MLESKLSAKYLTKIWKTRLFNLGRQGPSAFFSHLKRVNQGFTVLKKGEK